jgi:hypothetical protein
VSDTRTKFDSAGLSSQQEEYILQSLIGSTCNDLYEQGLWADEQK